MAIAFDEQTGTAHREPSRSRALPGSCWRIPRPFLAEILPQGGAENWPIQRDSVLNPDSNWMFE